MKIKIYLSLKCHLSIFSAFTAPRTSPSQPTVQKPFSTQPGTFLAEGAKVLFPVLCSRVGHSNRACGRAEDFRFQLVTFVEAMVCRDQVRPTCRGQGIEYD